MCLCVFFFFLPPPTHMLHAYTDIDVREDMPNNDSNECLKSNPYLSFQDGF